MTAANVDPQEWAAAAACASPAIDPEVFFRLSSVVRPGLDARPDGAGEARAICAVCTVRTPCLTEALRRESETSSGYRFGVWGGTTPYERSQMTSTGRSGR